MTQLVETALWSELPVEWSRSLGLSPVGSGCTVVGMCGRVVTATSPEKLSKHLRADAIVAVLDGPDHNVAPSGRLPIVWVSSTKDRRLLGVAKWGLLPPWATNPSLAERTFNARAETVAKKPSYRNAFRKRRCLVAVDGFYEWSGGTASSRLPGNRQDPKQPWYFYRNDRAPLALAGLWEEWVDPTVETSPSFRTCTVITVPANTEMTPIHHRMPAVLSEPDWEVWLAPEIDDLAELHNRLQPAPAGMLTRHPVDRRVGNARSKGSELTSPVDIAVPSTVVAQQGLLW